MKIFAKCALGKYGVVNALRLWLNIIPISIIMPWYLAIDQNNKTKLKKDIDRNWMAIHHEGSSGHIGKLIVLLATEKVFRNIFYLRLGLKSYFVQWLLPKYKPFNMATKSSCIGGGLFIQHGTASGINARSIGENLWINQRVSIGHTAKGSPIIGDNVTIGVGAVVLGPIKVGNNVNIGANAIVVDDVPDNVTVCSPKATIVKRH